MFPLDFYVQHIRKGEAIKDIIRLDDVSSY